jgi:TusA-related sulfurtransferase
MFDVGDSFVLRNENGVHLHVIIAEASARKDGEVMLVYLTSSKSFRDTTTIIQFGEHPFVTKKDVVSWIKYQNVMIFSRIELARLIVNDYGRIDDQLLGRIQDGIEKSDFVEEWKKNLFREWRLDRLYRMMRG